MDRHAAERFAVNWIANWNRKAVPAIVEHLTEDSVFVSPRAAAVAGSAVQRGRVALSAYWTAAAARATGLRFVLDRVLWDDDSQELLVLYTSIRDSGAVRACELMRFDTDGKQTYGEALYGAAVEPLEG